VHTDTVRQEEVIDQPATIPDCGGFNDPWRASIARWNHGGNRHWMR